MTPVMCSMKTDIEAGTYGDCMRACIATLMDLPSSDVPHFFHDDPDPNEAHRRIAEFLIGNKYAPFYTQFDAVLELPQLLEFMEVYSKHAYYILQSANHAVVCKGGKIVHDPAWYRTQLEKPDMFWVILVIAKS